MRSATGEPAFDVEGLVDHDNHHFYEPVPSDDRSDAETAPVAGRRHEAPVSVQAVI
jgi:hypothetical protein